MIAAVLGLFTGQYKLWIIGGLIAASLASVGIWVAVDRHQQREIGRAEIQDKWNVDNAKRTEAARVETEKNRLIEAERIRLAAQAQQRKDDEMHRINTRLAAALGELRNRPDRPAGGVVPGHPAAGAACTGAQLFRDDAALLVRESARADRVLAERDYCHERYEALKERK